MTLLHGQYEIIKRLGTGGMSQVFLCVDNHIKKKWAIKRIPYRENNLCMIRSEIEMLKSLDYYLFPRITDAFKDEKYYYIVTDYIEGESLENSPPIPESTVIRYVGELVKALRFLHCQSPPILYLDMKPSNIMVKPDGKIMLIDFGIAQSVIEPSKMLGTRGYAAPEQYIKGMNLSERTDVFSLGMTMYSLLTGDNPASTYLEQINKIKSTKTISNRMKKLILQCTSDKSMDRIATTDIQMALNRYIVKDRGVRTAAFISTISTIIFCVSAGIFSQANTRDKEMTTVKEMVDLVSGYVENGEYSKDGIRIICGYLDGNFLDEESKEYYTYVVARNLFEVQGDYLSAKHYFERLDNRKFPERDFFLKICDAMTGFDVDISEINSSIADFQKYNRTVQDKNIKEKNERVIKFVLMNEDNIRRRK